MARYDNKRRKLYTNEYQNKDGRYIFHYTDLRGKKCKVYAVDINKQCLDYVNSKAKDEKINCITTAEGREDYRHDFDDGFFDLVIYADMFHGEEKTYTVL